MKNAGRNFGLLTFLTLAALALSCSGGGGGSQNTSTSSPPTINLQGRIEFPDGSPLKSKSAQFTFFLNGAGLFPAGVNGCERSDDNAQGLQLIEAATRDDGTFSVSAPLTGFVRATDDTCPMSAQVAGAVKSVDVKLTVDVDSPGCDSYCKSTVADSCHVDCLAPGRKFTWSKTIDAQAALNGADSKDLVLNLNQLGPAITVSETGNLPDLQVDALAAANSAYIDHQTFSSDACELEDKCIFAPGARKLLRFDGIIQNIGDGDLVIGSPENNPLFMYSACHNHYHLRNIMTFELIDPTTGEVVSSGAGQIVGRKQGFCIEDMNQIAGSSDSKYDCENQGLTSGWADVYSASLGCQWIDVTDVAPGAYVLRLTVNQGRDFAESDYGNNSSEIPVTVPEGP